MVPALAGDNSNDSVTPVARVNAVVNNSHDIKTASVALEYGVPAVASNGRKDGDAAMGAAAGVSHAKGNKSTSKSGLGLATKGWGGARGGGAVRR